MAIDASAIALAALIVSPFVGSFLAVVALRLSKHEALILARSHCDSCGRTLRPWELLPLLSFALLRGRCSACANTIDPLHFVLEGGALIVTLWAVLVAPGWIVIASCVLGWTLLLLAAIDWRLGLLPDILTLPLLVAGLAVAAVLAPSNVTDHVIGAAVGFGTFAVISEFYRRVRHRAGLGLGDAKLLAAAGAWLSWTALPTVVLFAAFMALASVLVQRSFSRALRATDRIAFGPALTLATWLVWLYGPLLPR